MKNPKRDAYRSMTRGTGLVLLAVVSGIALTSPAWLAGRADGKHHHDDDHAITYRWDLIHLTGGVIGAGGFDWAKAADGSQITLTGSGTFLALSRHGERHGVTGGGTWETFDSSGASTASGTYSITGLVAFDVVPGATPAGTVGDPDNIGRAEDSRAGLLVLRVLYSDGEGGVLTVSCHGGGPVPAPDTIFEGITTTKGFVAYVDRGKPAPGVDANRTVFHVVSEDEDDDDDD